jgi:hypothetical protein
LILYLILIEKYLMIHILNMIQLNQLIINIINDINQNKNKKLLLKYLMSQIKLAIISINLKKILINHQIISKLKYVKKKIYIKIT